MSTSKRVFEVLGAVRDDEGRSAEFYAKWVGTIPTIVTEWLQMLELDGMLKSGFPPDGGSTRCWFITDRGRETLDWIYGAEPTEGE